MSGLSFATQISLLFFLEAFTDLFYVVHMNDSKTRVFSLDFFPWF